MKKKVIPYRVEKIDDVVRMADRLHAGGVADTIELQLEEPLPIHPQTRKALRKSVDQIWRLLHQAYCLEQMLDAVDASLKHEKKLNLDLRVENRTLIESNAKLQKENRTLKAEINKLMSNGGL
jgi:hypothetical protein